MNRFEIFNKSSEQMPEIATGAVDLIVTSPPYGIGTVYGDNKDDLAFIDYLKLIRSVSLECYRISKSSGLVVIEVADTIMREGRYIQLAALIQSFFLEAGFSLWTRHINFVNSESGVELTENYCSEKNSHSNSHQWLVFSKVKKEFDPKKGRIFYSNYFPTKNHPCPTPSEICIIILDMYYRDGFVVADPFMGTAAIGTIALFVQGKFYGYEIDPQIFKFAQEHLEAVDN